MPRSARSMDSDLVTAHHTPCFTSAACMICHIKGIGEACTNIQPSLAGAIRIRAPGCVVRDGAHLQRTQLFSELCPRPLVPLDHGKDCWSVTRAGARLGGDVADVGALLEQVAREQHVLGHQQRPHRVAPAQQLPFQGR